MNKLFQLEANPILHYLVFLFIKWGWFNNNGKFKRGDKVRYNWFARVYIWSAIKDKYHKVFTVSHYESWSKDQSNVVFVEKDDSGCDVFWLKKVK